MKIVGENLFSLFFCSVGALATGSAFAAQPSSSLVPIDSARVFAPVGFDDNDNTQVVLDGYLPSGCYRLTRPILTIDQEKHVIHVQAMARYFDIPCVEARIPYQLEVDIGLLPVGNFKVLTSRDTLQQDFTVHEALTAGPDDFSYAPIDSIQVKNMPNKESQIAVIEGRYTNSCMTMKEIKVIDSGATIEVLPIVTITGDTCADILVPYRQVVELPKDMSVGRHLLHVRSLNGRAMNYVFGVNQ